MTPGQQAAYRAGCIVSEMDARFGGNLGFAPSLVANASRLPGRLAVLFRHVWGEATQVPEITAMLEGLPPPNVQAATTDEQYLFWLGYHHHKIARDLPPTFPARLLKLRGDTPVADLARTTGLSRAAIYKLESGESRPDWDTVQRLAKALGVSTDDFRTE